MLAAAALPLGLAACSSGGSASASGGTATGTNTSGNAPANPDAGLLTGTKLKAALAPASYFASGFALDSQNSRDTGTTYEAPSQSPTSNPDCTRLGGTSWTDLTGYSGVSFAQNDYVDSSTSAELAQEIDVYQGTTATDVLTALGKLATVCPTYTDAQTSSKVTVSEKPTTGLGSGAYTITLTDSAWQSGTTLIAARVGTAVVTVLSTDGSDNGAAAATKLTQQVVNSLTGKA